VGKGHLPDQELLTQLPHTLAKSFPSTVLALPLGRGYIEFKSRANGYFHSTTDPSSNSDLVCGVLFIKQGRLVPKEFAPENLPAVSSFYPRPHLLVPVRFAPKAFARGALTFLLLWPFGVGAADVMGFRAQSASESLNSAVADPGVMRTQEKRSRTSAQKKIDSQLLYALYRKRGEARTKGVPSGELAVKFDDKGRVIVNIRARVTTTVLAKIKSAGGRIISSSARYNDIRAHLPLEKLEGLAALKDVFAIMPLEEATTNSLQQ